MKYISYHLKIFYSSVHSINMSRNFERNGNLSQTLKPKKCFSPLRISLHDWQKIETIRDTRYKKEKLKVRQDNLALFRRKHDVAHEEENDKELEINSIFVLLHIFLSFPINGNLIFFSSE